MTLKLKTCDFPNAMNYLHINFIQNKKSLKDIASCIMKQLSVFPFIFEFTQWCTTVQYLISPDCIKQKLSKYSAGHQKVYPIIFLRTKL